MVSILNPAVASYSKPRNIRVDNGSQFTSRKLYLWAHANGVILDFSRSEKPIDNTFIKALMPAYVLSA